MFRKNLLVAIPLFVAFSLSTSGCEKTSGNNQGNTSTCGYKLPWSNSLGKVDVLQGNDNKPTHKAEYNMKYAFDFDLPEGTPVLAARGGTISYVQTDKSACGEQELENKANYVVVDHGDGTSALYLHLQSVEVQKGQKVVQGQVLGYSGKTGWTKSSAGGSCIPHLHFQVQKTTNSWFGESIPICFDEVGVPERDQKLVSQNQMVAVLGIQVAATPTKTPLPSPTPSDWWPDSLIGTWKGYLSCVMVGFPNGHCTLILEIRREPNGYLIATDISSDDHLEGKQGKYYQANSSNDRFYYCFDVSQNIAGENMGIGDHCLYPLSENQLDYSGGYFGVVKWGILTRVK